MFDILSRSIARAGGIEVPDDVRIVPASRWTLWSLLKAMAAGIRRWRDRRATYRTLTALSDHHLKDIGLDRGMLDRAAGDLARIRFANDNNRAALGYANDNAPAGRSYSDRV